VPSCRNQDSAPAEGLRHQALGLGAGGGSQRIVNRDGQDPEYQRDHHPGAQELPYRHPARAHDDELGLAVEAQQRADAPHQHSERQQDLRERR